MLSSQALVGGNGLFGRIPTSPISPIGPVNPGGPPPTLIPFSPPPSGPPPTMVPTPLPLIPHGGGAPMQPIGPVAQPMPWGSPGNVRPQPVLPFNPGGGMQPYMPGLSPTGPLPHANPAPNIFHFFGQHYGRVPSFGEYLAHRSPQLAQLLSVLGR